MTLETEELFQFYGDAATARYAAKAAYNATERRLYALPILKESIKDNREELTELENTGMPLRYWTSPLIRVTTNKSNISLEEVCTAQKAELRARIAADEREVRRLENALSAYKSDPYYITIKAKYFDNTKDDDIAARLHCDPSTVRRNRKRLVKRIAIRLYGVDCL